VQAESDRSKIVSRTSISLRGRQRMVMEKRSEILIAIMRVETVEGLTRADAIRAFLKAQAEYSDWLQAVEARDLGHDLTAAQVGLLTREIALLSLEKFGLTVDALRIANDRKSGGFSIGRSTIYDWFKIKKLHGVSGLAPALTRDVQPLPKGFSEFLKFYARPSKPDITEALKDYLAANPDPEMALTIDQVTYALRVKLNNIEKNVGREGLLTLRSRLPYIQRSTENLFPTTIYTADGKTFDAEIADPVSSKPMKPEITSILDIATRYCVGFAISRKENVIAVTEALRNACSTYGICAIFYTDRGAGYKNKTFDDDTGGLMARLSITKMHALPYNSQAKGIIERFNGTVWNPLAQKFPTYIGETMDKEAGWAAHRKTRSDIREFGHSNLLMSWDDFRAKCAEAIAAYNARPHDGFPQRHPAQCRALVARRVRQGFRRHRRALWLVLQGRAQLAHPDHL
jgi:putative transposase